MTEKKKYYPELNAKINFPEMEKNILNFWEEDKTFEKSVHNRDGARSSFFTTVLRLPTARRITDILWYHTLRMRSPVFRQ